MKEGPRATWPDLLRRLAPLLPPSLFERLRAFPALEAIPAERERSLVTSVQEAISALDSLYHTLTTYLPRYLLELSPQPGEPRGELLEGSFIFADVTGFTALTGEMSRHGTAGREEMNRLMGSLLAAILEPLLTSGSDLLTFAGDAILAYFPARPDGEDARWATRTALRLVEAVRPFERMETPYGTFSLTMSAGVERGRALAAVIGSRKRMELLISGGPVQGSMQAEGAAEPGQVSVGPHILPLVEKDFTLQGNIVTSIRSGELTDYEAVPPARRRRRLAALLSRRIPDLVDSLEQALDQVEAIAPFIPSVLLQQIVRGEDFRRHPPVATQFVNILGLEELALGEAGPEVATQALQRYFVRAQEIVSDREGIISQVDPYARGFTLLNAFGAPTPHEGVPRLAASAALELKRALEQINQEMGLDPPLAQRIGMTYDRIFTGEIGYPQRREYVVAGPAVNLAARLMSKAEMGQIVLDPLAWEAVQDDFQAQPLPPIPLKGIAEPVPRFNLTGLKRGRGVHIADYPLIGRQREQAILSIMLDEAQAGRGGALALLGDAGLGKNHLAAVIANSAAHRGFAILTGRCQVFTQTLPYAPWADLVAEWFGLDDDASTAGRRQKLRQQLASFEMAPYLPAFTDLLGLPAERLAARAVEPAAVGRGGLFAALQREAEPQKSSVQELAALLRERAAKAGPGRAEEKAPSIWDTLRERSSIPTALPRLLIAQALRQPTLVMIEDIQWMDADSWRVLQAIASAARSHPLFLLLTARPGIEWQGDQLVLGALSAPDTEALGALILHAQRLEPALAEWLMARSAGNPLFVTTYCRSLREANAVIVDPDDSIARWSGPPPPLPLSLQELLLAEVGSLEPTARAVIGRAAMIGPAFPASLLAHLTRDLLPPVRLDETLDQMARRSIIAPPPPAPVYTFSSQSLHDAIYATLSHALRREWHGQIADYLAGADETARYERLEQIAYHYSLSDRAAQAAHFTRLAGDKSRARQAYETAATFYAQTLSVAADESTALDRCLAREGLGDLHALRDEMAESFAAYQAALESAACSDQGRLRAKIAMLIPLLKEMDAAPLAAAQGELPPDHALHPWLSAALCWALAEKGHTEAARETCAHLIRANREPLSSLMKEIAQSLERDTPLPSYKALFSIYADNCLRLASRGEM